MSERFHYPTEYFVEEGKANLSRCLENSFEAAVAHSIKKIVIFTSAGIGVKMALEEYCSRPEYSDIRIIAVTFPSQTRLPPGDPSDHCIMGEMSEYLANHGVPVVRAHLPFDPIRAHRAAEGLLGQDFSLISNALRIFCGSMSLCVQAVLMASDAGHVSFAEHVIAMTSDTSIIARAATTSRFLTDLIVREIICKPVLLTIGKGEKADEVVQETPKAQDVIKDSSKTLDLIATTEPAE